LLNTKIKLILKHKTKDFLALFPIYYEKIKQAKTKIIINKETEKTV